MITVTKRLEFDAAHRLLNHEGKCRHYHGHHYTAEVTVGAMNGLDSTGRVIDFSVIKSVLGTWIDENWDHNSLLNCFDPLFTHICSITPDREPFLFFDNVNPTAENIAKKLYDMAVELLPDNLWIIKVRIWETPTCYADYDQT